MPWTVSQVVTVIAAVAAAVVSIINAWRGEQRGQIAAARHQAIAQRLDMIDHAMTNL